MNNLICHQCGPIARNLHSTKADIHQNHCFLECKESGIEVHPIPDPVLHQYDDSERYQRYHDPSGCDPQEELMLWIAEFPRSIPRPCVWIKSHGEQSFVSMP